MVNGPVLAQTFSSLPTTRSFLTLHANVQPFTPIHTLMAGATMQSATCTSRLFTRKRRILQEQSVLPKDKSTWTSEPPCCCTWILQRQPVRNFPPKWKSDTLYITRCAHLLTTDSLGAFNSVGHALWGRTFSPVPPGPC